MQSKFRLDKTAFTMGKLSEQKPDKEFWLNKKPIERLEAAWYLICKVYGIDVNNPPKLDVNTFRKQKRN